MTAPANTFTRHAERLWTLGLALAAVAYVITVVCLTDQRFAANDNLTILDFIRHGYQVPFNGVLYTGLLHFAYEAFPSLPWYALSLYACHALSLFLWLTLLKRVFRPGWVAGILMLALLGCYADFLVLLDFTSTSVMLCMAGICGALVETGAPQPSRWRVFCFGLVFMAGVMVRVDGGTGALAFGLPFAIWVALTRLKSGLFRTENLRLALLTLLFLAPALGNLAGDAAWRQATLTPQQAQYDEFNAPRGEIHRVTNQERYALMRDKPLLGKLHWNQQQMGYFLNWYYLDERVYTTDALETIVQDMPYLSFSLHGFMYTALDQAWPLKPQTLLLLACLPLLLVGVWRAPWPNIVGLAWPGYPLILIAFMLMRFTFLERVSVPYETACGFTGLILAGLMVPMDRRPGRRMELAAVLAVCAAMLVCAWQLGRTAVRQEHHSGALHQALEQKLQTLNQGYAGSIVLIQAGPGLLMESSDPLHIVWPEFKPIDLGWSIYSPRFYEQIGALGIQHGYQLMDAFVDRPGAYLLGTQGWCENLLYFTSAQDKSSIRAVPVTSFGDGTTLCRLEGVKR